jgi:hypothetical protein
MAYLAVVTFFETARILLPWTIAATALAGLLTLAMSRWLRTRLGAARFIVTLPATVALTLGFGYLAWEVKPPSPPPEKPAKHGVEAVNDFLFTIPEPRITKDRLRSMLPVHLTISGLLGGVIVGAIVGGSVASGAGEPRPTWPDLP